MRSRLFLLALVAIATFITTTVAYNLGVRNGRDEGEAKSRDQYLKIVRKMSESHELVEAHYEQEFQQLYGQFETVIGWPAATAIREGDRLMVCSTGVDGELIRCSEVKPLAAP